MAKDHLVDLAREHHIEIHWTKEWRTAECDHGTRQAFLPALIRSALDYLTALHELGHLVDGVALDSSNAFEALHARRDRHYRRTLEEAAAWAWAVRHARPTLLQQMTPRHWAKVGWCWATYVAPA